MENAREVWLVREVSEVGLVYEVQAKWKRDAHVVPSLLQRVASALIGR